MGNSNPWQARLKQHEKRWPVDIQRLQAEAYGALMVAREGITVDDPKERRAGVHVYFTALSIFVKLMESVEWGAITSRLALLEASRQSQLALQDQYEAEDRHDADVEGEIEDPQWTLACEQAIMRGTFTELQQSMVLSTLPIPNKALVQSAVLAEIGKPRPAPTVAPSIVVQDARPPRPSTPDPEEQRLASLEADVWRLVHDLRGKVSPAANPLEDPR